APYAAHASSLIRAHDLNCLVERQSCLQKRAGGPALFLDEISDEQPVARIAAVTHPHRHIDGAVAERVAQLLERFPVLDSHVIGPAFPYPLGHEEPSKTEVLAGNDVRELVGTQISERARWRADISPVHNAAAIEIGSRQERVSAEG